MKVSLLRWQSANANVISRLRSGQDVVVEMGEFLNGVRHVEAAVLDGQARPTLLLDTEGKAFGIGTRMQNMAGQAVFQMKRGL
jgi:hypothetical protein